MLVTACYSIRMNPSETALERAGQNAGRLSVIHIDPGYFRHAEVKTLLGDPTNARQKLGWVPEIRFESMVSEIVAHDLAAARRSALLKEHGYAMPEPQERRVASVRPRLIAAVQPGRAEVSHCGPD
jgi:hypothetical protein